VTRREPVRWDVGAFWRADEGRVTAFVTVLVTAIIALAGLTLDGGLALASKVRAIGQAESAARAGAQAIDLDEYRATGRAHLDPVRAAALAQNYLAAGGATGQVAVLDDTVVITVTEHYPTQLLGLIGVHELTVTGSGRAHPQSGVTQIEP
jgi:hypothetical protein